jgi:hypothetical protein
MQMMQEERCLSCFEIDQRGRIFFKARERLTTGVCHRLYPNKADGWEPCEPDAFYWQEREENVNIETIGEGK